MSARNAQLQIENESMKNELENAKADYAELQSDMNDVRDYYHQVDVAASNMEHRCEVRARLIIVFLQTIPFPRKRERNFVSNLLALPEH